MTPLAHAFAKELLKPANKRVPYVARNPGFVREALADVHCFECTEILPICKELSGALVKLGEKEGYRVMGELMFLPAPKTWIELKLLPGSDRTAYFVSENPGGNVASVDLVSEAEMAFGHIGKLYLDVADYSLNANTRDGQKIDEVFPFAERPEISFKDFLDHEFIRLQLIIAAINTPQIVGRRQVMPHRGLEKNLRREFGVGKFPLHAWTEIKLQVSKPPDIEDGEPHEAHLTGRRALHFCRKHIRIKNGRLEYVRAHWRGDPAIGIKRSRYTVQP